VAPVATARTQVVVLRSQSTVTTLAHRRRHTFAEFLDVEDMSPEVRHEFVDGEILAMAGGSVEHSALATAFCGLLFTHLRGGPCRVHSSDLRIRIHEANVSTYADAVVVCDPLEPGVESTTHVTNPRVVVEVLSASTEDYDRHEKRLYYQLLPSLQEYVLVAQDKRRVEVWSRDGQMWLHSVHEAGTRAPLRSIRFELEVDDLYRVSGVNVP
jgi:Uma2 family endonuclease